MLVYHKGGEIVNRSFAERRLTWAGKWGGRGRHKNAPRSGTLLGARGLFGVREEGEEALVVALVEVRNEIFFLESLCI